MAENPNGSSAVLERVTRIVRRDLKLGPDIAITPDMPFFNSDVDIDSLDILLLLTSIEKEFGIKIPSQDVGRKVFENVGTLARYVEQNAPAAGTGHAAAAAAPAPEAVLQRLPHREPFRFISRVVAVKPGESAEGVWQLSGNEPFFAGHFPGNPLVPGVLIAEALAQVAGLIVAAKADAGANLAGKLAQVDVRFDSPVAPPAEITLRAKLSRAMGALHLFDVEATVAGTVTARGVVTLALSEA